MWLIPACTIVTEQSYPHDQAEYYLGLHERTNRQELSELLNVDPVRTEWCAAFVNAILSLNNIPNLDDINHPHPLTARAFFDWGKTVNKEDIQPGDLVIFPRGSASWQGHVGFFAGATDTYWIILGGNQDNTVSYKLFKPSRAIGIRRWIE